MLLHNSRNLSGVLTVRIISLNSYVPVLNISFLLEMNSFWETRKLHIIGKTATNSICFTLQSKAPSQRDEIFTC
jgi:hypothetical protein